MLMTPTGQNYGTLEGAYNHFNKALFGGALPNCLITVQRHKGAYGYFSSDRFGRVGSSTETTDEIAMNPMHFNGRSIEQTLSTLVHEMVHLWQHRFGKSSRTAYHNKQWADKMREVGLIPSDTGAPGGKETGQKMSHYIATEGAFERACNVWLKENPSVLYHDRMSDEDAIAKRKKKAASKTKYLCLGCGDTAAWGKPDLHLICGDCECRMESEQAEGDE